MTAASEICRLLLIFTSLAVSSCSWIGKDGTRHSLVLGIGILSTKERVQGDAIITRTSLCGLAIQRNPAMTSLIIGYAETLLAQIPPRWEGLLRVTKSPAQPLGIVASPPKRH